MRFPLLALLCLLCGIVASLEGNEEVVAEPNLHPRQQDSGAGQASMGASASSTMPGLVMPNSIVSSSMSSTPSPSAEGKTTGSGTSDAGEVMGGRGVVVGVVAVAVAVGGLVV
ncbi:hypothetical protein Q9189_007079 [Teloschistes chrysophthalmus]